MLGVIIGDIVGSVYEWDNIKTKEFELFKDNCFFTDDTLMTIAVGKALYDSNGDTEKLAAIIVPTLQQIGRPYPDAGYGGSFFRWLYSDNPKPYNSFGNGAAMRVSACGFAAQTLAEAKELSKIVTAVTHNHPEGLKGAEATTATIFLARLKKPKPEIKAYIAEHYYPLAFTLAEIRGTYRFNETCQDTVPQAIVAFLEADGFEDAIRNANSLGGDSDTLAAITGSIAEAYYGIPENLAEKARAYLDQNLLLHVDDFYRKYGNAQPQER